MNIAARCLESLIGEPVDREINSKVKKFFRDEFGHFGWYKVEIDREEFLFKLKLQYFSDMYTMETEYASISI